MREPRRALQSPVPPCEEIQGAAAGRGLTLEQKERVATVTHFSAPGGVPDDPHLSMQTKRTVIIWVGVDGIYIPFTYTHATRPPAAPSQFQLKWECTIAPPAVIFSFPFSLPFHPLTVLGPDLLQPERGRSILRTLKLSSRQLCLWPYAFC